MHKKYKRGFEQLYEDIKDRANETTNRERYGRSIQESFILHAKQLIHSTGCTPADARKRVLEYAKTHVVCNECGDWISKSEHSIVCKKCQRDMEMHGEI